MQTLYENSNTLFELIGVHITRLEKDNNHLVDEDSEISQSELADDGGEMAHISTRNNESFIPHCCALSFYSICFSVVKACTYWNSQTLEAIIDHGNEFYKEQFSCPDENLCYTNFQTNFKYMMQLLMLSLQHKKKAYLVVHPAVANSSRTLFWITQEGILDL